MNVINIQEIPSNTNITSVGDTAMFLNLTYPEAVNEILESFTDFSDFDIIAELSDNLNLNLTAVIENVNIHEVTIHGYLHNQGVVA